MPPCLRASVPACRYDADVHAASEDLIYGALRELYDAGHNVSPSAEHGIGLQKLTKVGKHWSADAGEGGGWV